MANTDTPQIAVSDFNLQKLQTPELAEHVSASIQLGGNIAIFGRRGTGKTAISKQQIAASDMHEVYINLSVLERVDLGGYPNIMGATNNQKFVDFLMPQFYQPMMEGKKGVVALLDEVDKADPSLWAPLLEFTQDKSINGKKLPNLRAIIMTGNLISEGGSRPSLPLLDRTEKYLVEADAGSWLKWAGEGQFIHPSITAYIHDNPKDLFGAVDPEDRYADPSPRGWHRSSDILRAGEARGWSPELLNKKVCGCIGKDAGIKYSNYYAYYQELLPMIDDIYQGKNVFDQYNKLEPSKQIITCMITCARFGTLLDQTMGNSPGPVKNVAAFLNRASDENVLVSVRSQITVRRLIKFSLDEHPDWEPILTRVNKKID